MGRTVRDVFVVRAEKQTFRRSFGPGASLTSMSALPFHEKAGVCQLVFMMGYKFISFSVRNAIFYMPSWILSPPFHPHSDVSV